jgi:hypothetical protein
MGGRWVDVDGSTDVRDREAPWPGRTSHPQRPHGERALIRVKLRGTVTDRHPHAAAGWRPIRLRSVFQPFASRVDLGPGTVELWLPVYFGRRRPFAIPMAAVAVADLRGALAGAPRGDFDVEALTIPYLSTSGQVGEPNLLLLFSEPQRLPRIGWRGLAGLPGVSVRQVNRPEGWYVDGVALQVRGDVLPPWLRWSRLVPRRSTPSTAGSREPDRTG